MAPPSPRPSATHGSSSAAPPRRFGLGGVILAVIAVLSIGSAVWFTVRDGSSGDDLRSNLTYIAPAGVGGGWDSFAREGQQALRGEGIVNNVQVVNIPGAGGTIGLSSFVTMTGQADTVMATGAAMTGGIATNDSQYTLEDVRPLARLAEDYNAFIVKADAEWTSMDELVEAWRQDPSGIVWTGGSVGSIDHLVIAQLALSAGIDPAQIRFIPKAGGGESVQSLMADTADVAVTGFNEVGDQIDAGRVRGLAITAPERFADHPDLPTFTELGYDVDLVNWRGIVAAPGITDEEFASLEAIVQEMHDSESWRDSLERNRWRDSFLTGDELTEFLRKDQETARLIVKELGL